jgi:hypothetical protein
MAPSRAGAVIAVVAIVSTVLSVVAPVSSAAPPSGPVSWISTGDSYSSGEGVQGAEGPCSQSQLAFGPLAAERLLAQHWKISPEVFTACTGHLVEDEFHARPDSGGKASLWDWGKEQGGPDQANIITLSFGGNDIGFADYLTSCLGEWATPATSFASVVGGGSRAQSATTCGTPEAELNSRIDALLDPPSSCADRRHQSDGSVAHFDCRLLLEGDRTGSIIDFYTGLVHDHLTPDGTLVVVGYPSLFAPVSEWGWYEQAACAGITRSDAERLIRVSQHLDDKLREAVERANQQLGSNRVRYVSREQLFRDGSHELCGTGDDWINGLTITGHEGSDVYVDGSFHPNANGHDATADAVLGAIAGPRCDQSLMYDADARKMGFTRDDPRYADIRSTGDVPRTSTPSCSGEWAVGVTIRPDADPSTQLFQWVGSTWKEVSDFPPPYSVCDLLAAGVPDDAAKKLAPSSDTAAAQCTSPTVQPQGGDGQAGTEPVLGLAAALPGSQGFGVARPTGIFGGGDPSGIVSGITWTSWGGAKAEGDGTALNLDDSPGKSVLEATTEEPAHVVAWDLGTCGGKLAYRKVSWYFHGKPWSPNDYSWDICNP